VPLASPQESLFGRREQPPERLSAFVGLLNVYYFAGDTEIFRTYDQWHTDGLEFEVNSIYPGAICQGTFKQMGTELSISSTSFGRSMQPEC